MADEDAEPIQISADPSSIAPAFDPPQAIQSGSGAHDWSRSYHGLSSEPFKKEVADILLAPVEPGDVEIKPGQCMGIHNDENVVHLLTFTTAILCSPTLVRRLLPVCPAFTLRNPHYRLPDGLLYLPEIKYRRILNRAFGPGGWGLAPRSETNVGSKVVSREYGLICLGRLVSVARGEQDYFDPSGVATATEGCKSNALMRCCKDLGIASELW